jgi:hypothetical protein
MPAGQPISYPEMEKRKLLKQSGSPWTKPVYPTHQVIDLNDKKKEEMQAKYVGYPGLATWMASSPDFFILRRFDYLNTRILLTLQDRIVEKEEQLKLLDLNKVWEKIPNDADDLLHSRSMNGSVRQFLDEETRQLLDEIKDLLKEYSESTVQGMHDLLL